MTVTSSYSTLAKPAHQTHAQSASSQRLDTASTVPSSSIGDEGAQVATHQAPHFPRSKVLAVGAFLTAGIHKAGNAVEQKVEGVYERKMASAVPRAEPLEISAPIMQVAKVASGASKGFSSVAGGAAKLMDDVAAMAGKKAAPKGVAGNVLGQGLQVVADVQEAAAKAATSVVAKAGQCHVDYMEHTRGPAAAELSRHAGRTAKNVTSGYFDAQKVMHPSKGLAKGLVKNAVLKEVGLRG